MKTINKAFIKYRLREDDDFTEIRFHSVIFEEHDVSNEITKFPVQSGFNISNHSIRKNRKVSIKAIITDTQMASSSEFYKFSNSSNSRAAYDALKDLVRQAVPCTVVTNLTEYYPVIFNSFKNKQEAGMTDAMTFTISGEEVQVSKTVNKATPVKLTFTPVPDSEREARLAAIREAGFFPPNDIILSEATVDLSKSFVLETTDVSGNVSTVTYDNTGLDAATSEHSYECSISEDGTITDSETGAAIPGAPTTGLLNGANVFGACLTESVVNLATSKVTDVITTAVGDLRRSAYGALYEKLGVNGNRSMGQKLLAMGLDCFIVGATATQTDEAGNPLITADQFDTTLPTVDDALKGATKIGDGLITDVAGQASPTIITKMTGSSTGSLAPLGGLL